MTFRPAVPPLARPVVWFYGAVRAIKPTNQERTGIKLGDRGNIAVLQSDGDQVWLYSHWGGTELPERLQDGLAAGRGRWNDEPYLTKIIFGYAVPNDNWQEETGYGISCRMQDNEHPINVVDIPKQRVFTMLESQLKDGKVPPDYEPDKWQSFQEYALSGQSFEKDL